MKKNSLRQLLTRQTVLVASIPLVLLMAAGYFLAVPTIEESLCEQQGILATSVGEQAKSFLNSAVVSIRTFTIVNHDAQANTHQLQHVLDAAAKASGTLSALYLVENGGVVRAAFILSGGEPRLQDVIGSDLSNTPIVKAALSENKEIWSNTFLSPIGGSLSVAIAIPSERSVVVGEIALDRLSAYLGELRTQESQLVMVIDRKGQVIADARGRYTAQQYNIGNLDLVRLAPQTGKTKSGKFDFEGRTMLGSVVVVPETQWRILIALPLETVHETLWEGVRLTLLALIAALAAAGIASIQLSRKLARQFTELQEHSREVAQGTTQIAWPRSNIREFDGLSADLESMAASIRDKEKEIVRNESRLRLLVEIMQRKYDSAHELLEYALVKALELTESKIGYIYYYDEGTEKFTLNSWSKGVMAECEVINPQTTYDLKATGLWGEAVRQRKPIVVNDYRAPNPLAKSYPEGHVPLEKFLTVPITIHGKIVGVLGLANKEIDYDESDLLQSSLLMDSVWRMLEGLASVQEKEALQEKLAQSQKMEAIGKLAGGVAHDFNNMLGVIIGHTELALAEKGNTTEMSGHLRAIDDAAQRSAEITRQLLAFARKQTVTPKIIDITEAISSILTVLRSLLGEEIEISFLPGAKPGRIKIDPAQMDQILTNLVTNARDAIAGIGRLTLETSVEKIDAGGGGEREERAGEYVVLTVTDTGCGIPANRLKDIFEPFYTTKPVGKGTGLGLSTVYGIVSQNEGFIRVYSEVGKGSTFSIYLPKVDGPWKEAQAEQGSVAGAGTETILLVEDERANLELLRRYLTTLGYKVLTADNPEKAIRLAMEKGKIDLLITDVVMPVMNGRQLAEAIRSINMEIKCLYMSGYTADVIADRGIVDDGVNFIQKPYSLKEMAERIRETLAARG